MPFKVQVADNFRYMDEDARTTLGTFATYEEAVEACKQNVWDYLQSAYQTGMTATALYQNYRAFGEDPFIVGDIGANFPFSAWSFAQTKSAEICRLKES